MFFKKPSIGLNISDYSIEIISLGGSFESPKLLAMGRTILEQGIIEDGKIIKKEKLENTLKNLIKSPQFGKIKTNEIIFSFPESKSFFHIFKIPAVLKTKEELELMNYPVSGDGVSLRASSFGGFHLRRKRRGILAAEIKSQISQIFPYQLKDLYFDYKIKNREVFVAAAPKNIINDYLDVFKNCKLKIQALEIESESLSRVFLRNKEEPILIIDIGAKTTNFSLFDEKGLRLSVTIEVAGNKFTKEIAEKLEVSIEEAEKIKKEIGLNPEPKEGKVFLVLQKEIQEIIKEIKKIDDYFQDKEEKNIKKIILTGGSSLLPNLSEYLTENVEKGVVIADPWVKIDIKMLRNKEYFKKALEVSPILYSAAIGAALRGLIKKPKEAGINLIKKLK